MTEAMSNNEFRIVLRAVESGDNKAKTKLAWYKLSGCGGCEIDEIGRNAMKLIR